MATTTRAAVGKTIGAASGMPEPTRPIWTTQGPTAWPSPPDLMSYSALRDIETCPLRWGLRQGNYADVWAGKGYPPAPAGATLAGHVVHVALERIVRAVGDARDIPSGDPGNSHRDPMALVVEALRALGGISAVLDGVIRETVSEWESNPRLRPRAKELANELQRQLPALRPRVQHFLNHVRLSRLSAGRGLSGAEGGNQDERTPRLLAPGLHAEVPLVNEELGWYGKADLLRVGTETEADGGDEIVDFKTGLPKPDHPLQLRIYALLWAREARRNPGGRRVRKLTVLYGSGPLDVSAPILDEELDGVAEELTQRTVGARAAVQQHPPPARPSREACEWCDVRHMCPAYWAPATRAAISPPASQSRQQADVGVQIVQRQGSWSWVGIVREIGALSDEMLVGARVLLRARPHDEHFASLIAAGGRLRIVAAQFAPPSDESGGLPVLSLTKSTEAFQHAPAAG
jgi:hypothetical protein